jgi:hypothetical protein
MNEVIVVTLYIQYETMNEFWGVYRNKTDAINSIRLFIEETNKESSENDNDDDREVWELISKDDTYQVWREKTFGYQKEFHFQNCSL